MEKIIMGKGFGKTYQLIKKSAESGDYIVCHSQDECSRIQSEAYKLKINIRFPITYEEFINKRYHVNGVSGFLIDNVEMFLQSLTQVPINAITLTT